MNKFLVLFQVHAQFVAFRLILDIARLSYIAVAIAISAAALSLLTGGDSGSVDDNHSGTALSVGLGLIAASGRLLLLLFAIPRKGGIGHNLIGVPS